MILKNIHSQVLNLRCFGDLPISSTQNNIRVTSDQKIEGDKRDLNEKKVDFDTEAIKSLNTKRTNDSGDPSGKRKVPIILQFKTI